ncbi:hypothetical protein AVEN_266456-1 [Araneus ventricosus]|uniref:Uncharacterized protein n=1 Tax=Araneus ventricosus TaxID=182803 RepID=A0A4Y2FSX3_ARAVE|nr:hypothetical protein AVEN_266456-1 [Araneus ventricosus]
MLSVVPDVLTVENLFIMANCGKRKRVVVSMALRLDNDDDGDDIVENTTSLIYHTDGMKVLDAALPYVEQQSSASPTDVMVIKKIGETMRQIAELLGFNKKSYSFFNGM